MIDNLAQLLHFDSERQLATLAPVPDSMVADIAARHPGISEQYLEFLRAVGTGETARGMYVYAPDPASSVEQHPSYKIYNSAAYASLFGPRKGDTIPADAVAVADSGASWRYCLCPSLGEGVFCLDMSGPTFTKQHDDFFTFVATSMILDSWAEDAQPH
jgi:hypothetical protein